jgi:argininosuccinate lyase
MPQKRNPDAAELVRAKTGRITGGLVALLTVMKGLALTYAKDMQEDKEPVFECVDSLALCLAATTGMVEDMTVSAARMRQAATAGFTTATDLADYLVTSLGLPFRAAHHVTGKLVKFAEERGVTLDALPLDALQSVEPRLTDAVYAELTVEASMGRRTSYGGTAPERVRAALRAARERFL